jgi:AAA domain
MILFLNGPFGIGKTTVATILVQQVPHAMLYDPEEVGSLVQKLVRPIEQISDFQDLAPWRTLVVEVARSLKGTYRRTLIIPMTIWRHDYFETIIKGLHDIDPDTICFRLTASKDTLMSRILSRPETQGPHAWCITHLEVGIAASNNPFFGIEIQTDGYTPAEVARMIMETLSIDLQVSS